ncbi:ABC transporter ATP-binding protein [Candidatus Pacearchaeota archaeon]|nr:ABC transporter ATP-binding protein [Candidatus Pacearchaeota archaeon]
MLEIKNLKRYFGGVKAVDDCSFKIEKGKITALIGPNGSGKTTVFNLISGILKEDSGKTLFDGIEITHMTVEETSNLGISRLFQQPRLFGNLSVRENLIMAIDEDNTRFWKNLIGYKLDREKGDKINEIAKLTSITAFMDKQAKNLSFGQKRLAEIARALVKPHKFLMLDEPVAGVTPPLRKEISELLLKLKKQGETILLIEHDMNFTLNVSDKVVVLDSGKVIAQGSPKQIKTNPKVLEAYLGD